VTGWQKVLIGCAAAMLPTAAGCGMFGTELAETRKALAEARAELEKVDADRRKVVRELAAVRAAADTAREERKSETAELQKAIDRLRGSVGFLKRKWQAAEARARQLAKADAAVRKPTTAPQE